MHNSTCSMWPLQVAFRGDTDRRLPPMLLQCICAAMASMNRAYDIIWQLVHAVIQPPLSRCTFLHAKCQRCCAHIDGVIRSTLPGLCSDMQVRAHARYAEGTCYMVYLIQQPYMAGRIVVGTQHAPGEVISAHRRVYLPSLMY